MGAPLNELNGMPIALSRVTHKQSVISETDKLTAEMFLL